MPALHTARTGRATTAGNSSERNSPRLTASAAAPEPGAKALRYHLPLPESAGLYIKEGVAQRPLEGVFKLLHEPGHVLLQVFAGIALRGSGVAGREHAAAAVARAIGRRTLRQNCSASCAPLAASLALSVTSRLMTCSGCESSGSRHCTSAGGGGRSGVTAARRRDAGTAARTLHQRVKHALLEAKHHVEGANVPRVLPPLRVGLDLEVALRHAQQPLLAVAAGPVRQRTARETGANGTLDEFGGEFGRGGAH